MTTPNAFSEELVGRAILGTGGGLVVAPYDADQVGDPNWHPQQQPIATAWLAFTGASESGEVVTPETAIATAAVLACVNVIATSLATLPIEVVNVSDSTPVPNHPLVKVLNRELNEEMTAADGREAMMVNALMWGNGFSYIERDEFFQVQGLWPIRSAGTSPGRYPGGELFYRAITGGVNYTFAPDQLTHLRDMSWDGIVGMARTRYGKNVMGLALAMEKYAAKFFSQGANVGGIVKLAAGTKPDAVENFKVSWRRENAGQSNAFKTALFTDGMDFIKTGSDPRNSQMIDTRAFQVREIARLFRVPPHKIGDLSGATFSNIEQQNMEFVNDCLRPWATKDEQELSRKLLQEREKGVLRLRYNFDELLRGDTTARYAAYNLGLQGGWITRNEVRRKEGLPPIPGGDVALQPLNMGNAGGDPTKQPPPKADPDKKEDEQDDEEEND